MLRTIVFALVLLPAFPVFDAFLAGSDSNRRVLLGRIILGWYDLFCSK